MLYASACEVLRRAAAEAEVEWRERQDWWRTGSWCARRGGGVSKHCERGDGHTEASVVDATELHL